MKIYWIIACVGLAACGTTAENSDVSLTRTWVEPKGAVSDSSGISIVPTGPPLSASVERVSGHSCRNKMWDPPPSDENATALMKQQAASKGYNAIHSVQVIDDPAALVKNCWAARIATGIAFKAPVAPVSPSIRSQPRG